MQYNDKFINFAAETYCDLHFIRYIIEVLIKT